MQAPLPEDEAARLQALYHYHILDTSPEAAFDELTCLAAHLCGMPIALISLVDSTRQWFKSKVGLDVSETSRSVSFCAHTILQLDPLIVRNVFEDARFADNPLVTSDPKIGSYAGVPLITPRGHAIGTLCVIDCVPRNLGSQQVEALQTLARQVVAQLELRRNLTNLTCAITMANCLEVERHQQEIIERQRVKEERDQLLVREQKARAEAEAAQQRFLDIVHGLDAIITEVDAVTWKFSFVSQRAEAILGYPVERWLTEPNFWVNLVHPDDLEEAAALCQAATAQGANHVFEYRVLAADGRVVWIRDFGSVILDDEGRPQRLHDLMVDITEEKRAEETLLATQKRLQHLIASGPAVIYSSKPTGDYGITFISENITSQLGYKAQEFIQDSRFWVEHVHSKDLPRVLTEFSRLVEQESQTCEYRFRHQDGTYRWIQDELKLVRDKAGKPLELLGCWQDITERKQVEAELYKREKLLCSVAKATNQLLTNPDFRSAITEALAILGVAAAVDRVYIYENHPHPITGEPAMSARFEWTQETVNPSISQPHWQNQPYSAFGMTRWYDALSSGQPIQGVTQELPKAEQDILQRDHILSILLVPIHIDETFWGYIGFDECHSKRRWSQSEESILVAMAASIGGALKRQQAEAQLLHNALHDPLTNLPNRALFIDRLGSALKRSKRRDLKGTPTPDQFAVLFLDLDRFKVINDSLGHLVGDQLLIAIAARLEACLRPGDTIARLGGDEFAILIEQIKDLSDALFVIERLQAKLALPFNLRAVPVSSAAIGVPDQASSPIAGSHEVFTTASIGIALSSGGNLEGASRAGYPYQQPQDLLRDADAAMYRAKSLGKDRYEVFDSAMHTQAVALLRLETDLRGAIERQEFILHYQPIIRLETGVVTGFEALVRWQHPERGLVPPAEFIPIAEETGLIVPLGQWVLRQACHQLQDWQLRSLASTSASLSISVNLSSKQFQEPDLIRQIDQVLQETGLKPSHLKLEITENLLLEKSEAVTARLLQLQALGTQLCMDDFGTGYSSLSYLHRFPLSVLKIDRSFIQAMGRLTTPEEKSLEKPPRILNENLEIVRTIVKLARTLRMDVVAEGIETAEQLHQLKALGCTYGQGYFFSRPVDSKTAGVMLQDQVA